MPLINVKLIESVLTAQQKQLTVQRLTDTMAAIVGENVRSVTWVIIEEVKTGDWGVGGNLLTTADARALIAGAPKT